ncbi:tRNA lysidine(34) synthetase TilS [Roseibium sp. HPY-6]|uniref:tRNA lysidine(34) synthetase TilS n=1 Tax=Roseibium sp. HPY-6 TaxID=3229852 RepID=UPI00338E315D
MHSVPDKPAEPQGLSADEVDTLLSCLKPFSNLALGVSGGADSLCLMVLFSEWRLRTSWPGNAEVLVVDHGLRTESTKEAQFVLDTASAHGLSAHLLTWHGEKPLSNIQETARSARYRLIAEHMNGSGAQALVLGHHLDDQAETFLDRLTRGSGVSGLSAMSADEANGAAELRLLRPLLAMRKKRLEASLRDRQLTWCEDPSNHDAKYKRSRLRRILNLLEQEGLSAEKLAVTAGHLRRSRMALDETVSEFVSRHLEHHPAGPVRLSRAAFVKLPEDLRLRLLKELAGMVTGKRPRPRLLKLQAVDAVLGQREPVHQSLSGAVYEADNTYLWCWREPGRVPPATLTGIRHAVVWDNRYRFEPVTMGERVPDADRLNLGPLMNAPVNARDIDWPDGWPKAAFDSSPLVWSDDGQIYDLPVTVKTKLDKNNHRSSFNLERLPIRGRLSGSWECDGDGCGEI